MTVRLTLICHAHTTALSQVAFGADESLTERGVREAASAASSLRGADIVHRGPAPACAQTAAALGLTARIDPELRDCDFGRWRGRTLSEIEDAEPEAVHSWLTDPAATPHGGESILDLRARARDWLDRQARGRGRQIAITHAAVIRAAAIGVLGAPGEAFWRIDVPPLARITLTAYDGTWRLRAPT